MAGSTAASETAALVLVDRCLDLVTPLSHTDHVLDQIYGTLQRRLAAGNPAVRWFYHLTWQIKGVNKDV